MSPLLAVIWSKRTPVFKTEFPAKCGEIDLIMRDKQQLVFVEVKYRQSNQYGHALEMNHS